VRGLKQEVVRQAMEKFRPEFFPECQEMVKEKIYEKLYKCVKTDYFMQKTKDEIIEELERKGVLGNKARFLGRFYNEVDYKSAETALEESRAVGLIGVNSNLKSLISVNYFSPNVKSAIKKGLRDVKEKSIKNVKFYVKFKGQND
jgi:hypothetical protein